MSILREALAVLLRRPRGRVARLVYDLAQVALALAVGIALFDRVLMPVIVRQGWDATVPDLRGTKREEWGELLQSAHLREGQVLEVSDRESPAGEIISQDPPAGARVRKGRLVHVLVSQGVPVQMVPDLVGKTVRSARLDLVQQGLQQGRILVLPSESVPEGEVIGTHPQRGAAPGRDGSVDLLVSGGQQRTLYLMPDFRGVEVAEVARRLRAVGVAVTVPESFGIPYVSLQSPPPGEPIATGQSVALNMVVEAEPR